MSYGHLLKSYKDYRKCSLRCSAEVSTLALPRRIFATASAIAVHPSGDFGYALLRAGLVPIAAWRSADAEPSDDLIAALDRDTARKG